jgi:perosamine synthetase
VIVPRMRLGPAQEGRLLEAFRAGHFVTGPHLAQLESVLAERTGFEFAVPVSSGFAALHLALDAFGCRGHDVIVPAVSSCFAVLHAVTAAGAAPRFLDVDGDGMLSETAVAAACAADGGRRVGAILSPPLFGLPGPEFTCARVPIIEDAAQGLLRAFRSRPVADCVVFSFYPTKMANGIDGGALLTAREDIARVVRDKLYYGHQTGRDDVQRFNYRMANVHAAVALDALDDTARTERRLQSVAAAYDRILAGHPSLRRLGEARDRRGLTRYVVEFPDALAADTFLGGMRDRGVECGREFVALAGDDRVAGFTQAKRLLECTVSLPFYPDLRDEELEFGCAALTQQLASKNS